MSLQDVGHNATMHHGTDYISFWNCAGHKMSLSLCFDDGGGKRCLRLWSIISHKHRVHWAKETERRILDLLNHLVSPCSMQTTHSLMTTCLGKDWYIFHHKVHMVNQNNVVLICIDPSLWGINTQKVNAAPSQYYLAIG